MAEIDGALAALSREVGAEVTCRQTNREGELVDWIQEATGRYDGLLLNPGAYTHTSIAVRDALALATDVPLVACDAREGRSVVPVMVTLVEHALARSMAGA